MSLKPGLTGLASVYFIDELTLESSFNDRYTFEKWMIKSKNNLNLIYFKNKNLCFDIKIIYITIMKIFMIKSSF
jgi:lipopolysaccharide/colanic/teichoic acid biosynthesis glycosyltransferase